MAGGDDYYDFYCGNDAKLVKVAVTNDTFHTARIQAETAVTLDLTGGMREVETVRIFKCFKLTRINWPSYVGSVRRLELVHAEVMTRLDLAPLKCLDELIILNCPNLIDILNVPTSLRVVHIDGVKLEKFNITPAKRHLEVFDVTTTCPNFTADLTDFTALEKVSIAIRSEAAHG